MQQQQPADTAHFAPAATPIPSLSFPDLLVPPLTGEDADVDAADVQHSQLFGQLASRKRLIGACPVKPLPFPSQGDVEKEMSRKTRFIVQFDIRHVGMPIGFTAFTALWRALALLYNPVNVPDAIYIALWYFTVLLSAVVFGMYFIRSVMYPHLLHRDFQNSVLTFFFGGIGIVCAGLVLAMPANLVNMMILKIFFFVFCAYQLSLALFWYSSWLFAVGHSLRGISPVFFMATMNFFLAASISTRVGQLEIGMHMFMIGTLFWLLVFISAFSFLSTVLENISDVPSPTLFLFIGPPAAAAMAWINISRARGDPPLNDTVRFFSAVTFFLYLLLLRLFANFHRMTFNVTYWAYVFPLCTSASLAVELAPIFNNAVFMLILATTACVIVTGIVVAVSTCTVRGICNGRIPQSELSLRVHYQKLMTDSGSQYSTAHTLNSV
jgi:tellurite resistance protein